MAECTTTRLTRKQERFAAEYLIDLNATQAAIRAGYSARTAYSMGQRLLKNAAVSPAIQREMDLRAQRTAITADYVLKNIVEVGERCMQKRWPAMIGQGRNRKQLTELVTDPQTGEEIEAHVWQFDSQGALRAQELLGKHLKLWTDKLEIKDDLSQVSDEELEQRLAVLTAEMGYVKADGTK